LDIFPKRTGQPGYSQLIRYHVLKRCHWLRSGGLSRACACYPWLSVPSKAHRIPEVYNAHYLSSRKAMAAMILGFSRGSNLSYTTA